FDKIIYSKNIIEKLKSKSIIIDEITNTIRRGVPNSKIDFVENSNILGIKSTSIVYPYYLPNSNIHIDYLESKDLVFKTQEFNNELILLPRTTLRIRAVLKS